MPQKPEAKAVAYYRTSSAANVGEDKDSRVRQAEAVHRYAKAAGYEIEREFYDAAVSGADPIDARPGFTDMLTHCADNGVTVILIETADRLARDLMVQEVAYRRLVEQGITVVPVDSPSHFQEDNPTADLIRQVLGAIAQFDKAQTVAKLRGARDRASVVKGRRVEGRKPHAEKTPAMVREAKRLARRNPRTGKRRSLRQIARELAALGYTRPGGEPFNAQSVKNMIS